MRILSSSTCVLTVLIVLATPPRLGAVERMFRLLDQRDGLPASEVVRLTQDARGFIWIGTFAGLVRYDGQEMRAWAPDRLNGHVSVLQAGPAGEVIVRVEPGHRGDVDASGLYRIVPGGIEPVPGPDDTPLRHVGAAAFGGDGQLCVSREADVLCRLAGGAWVTHTFDDPGRELLRTVVSGPDLSVVAVTDGGIWQLTHTGDQRKLAAIRQVVAVVPHADGSLYVSTFSDGVGEVHHLSHGQRRTVLSVEARPIALAVRGDVLWASFDLFLAVVHADGAPEILGPDDGIPSGGPLLVDREGSLWLGAYMGVIRFAEPDTVVFTGRDGLPSGHTRFLTRTGDTMWVGTWQGLGRFSRVGARWRPDRWTAPGRDRMCADGEGRLWLRAYRQGVVRQERDRQVVFGPADVSGWLGCHRRPDGTVWLSMTEGLFLTPGGDGPPLRVSANPPGTDPEAVFRQALEDRSGNLWTAADERVCHAKAAAILRQGDDAEWHCQDLPGARGVSSLVELADGHLWLATDRSGVWSFTGEAWIQVPGSSALPSYALRGLVVSGDGSVWILGHGTVVRVREAHDEGAGWQALERLTGVQGLPSAAAEHVLEEPDGSVWITTIVGVVRVPASARSLDLRPPPVELVDIMVNGVRLPAQTSDWQLSHDDLLELRFAALSYRDRSLLRHQYRLRPGAAWTSASGEPEWFRFPGLAPGRYTLQIRASLDGRMWTEQPAEVSFEILPPWYSRTWALLLFAVLMAGLLYTAYRLRVAVLLGLERQRTRIAMDLHDEVGSGLGSIHILAGLTADRVRTDPRLSKMVGDITDTAADLSLSLSEIVWSLRSPSQSLEMLIAHLTERAARLFPNDSTTAFRLDVPDPVPAVTLSLAVRRNVSLIVVEALHNAARHADATEVVLGARPEGHRWVVWVSDNGRGTPDTEAQAPGHGRAHMRRRADEIGATITSKTTPGGGLTVTVRFDPQATGRQR